MSILDYFVLFAVSAFFGVCSVFAVQFLWDALVFFWHWLVS